MNQEEADELHKGLRAFVSFVFVVFEPYSRILCTMDVFVGLELPDLHGEEGWGQPSSPNPLILRL